MDMSDPTPRVNFQQLQMYIGKKVRLVSQIDNVEGPNQVRVKAADGGSVMVYLRGPANFESKFVEFEGLVESPNSIKETDHTAFGNSFDMNNYNELCKLANGPFLKIFL